jgi:hypothetical protein
MTMDFEVRDPAILNGLKPGQAVAFDMVKQGGNFLVTAIRPQAAVASPAAAAAAQPGHQH